MNSLLNDLEGVVERYNELRASVHDENVPSDLDDLITSIKNTVPLIRQKRKDVELHDPAVEKPAPSEESKVGLLKLVNIDKLLDPNKVALKTTTVEDDSVLLISDSDSDITVETPVTRTRRLTRNERICTERSNRFEVLKMKRTLIQKGAGDKNARTGNKELYVRLIRYEPGDLVERFQNGTLNDKHKCKTGKRIPTFTMNGNVSYKKSNTDDTNRIAKSNRKTPRSQNKTNRTCDNSKTNSAKMKISENEHSEEEEGTQKINNENSKLKRKNRKSVESVSDLDEDLVEEKNSKAKRRRTDHEQTKKTTEKQLVEDMSDEEMSRIKKKYKKNGNYKKENQSTEEKLDEDSSEGETSKTKLKSEKNGSSKKAKESAKAKLDEDSSEEDTSNTKKKCKKSSDSKEEKKSAEDKLDEELSEEEKSKTKKKSRKSSNSKEGKQSAEDELDDSHEEEMPKTEKKSKESSNSKEGKQSTEDELDENSSEEDTSNTKNKFKKSGRPKEANESVQEKLNEVLSEEERSKTKKKSKKGSSSKEEKKSSEDELDENSSEEDTSNTKNKFKKSGRPKEANESVQEKLNEDLSEEERSKTKKKSKKGSSSKEEKKSSEDELDENSSEEGTSNTKNKSKKSGRPKEAKESVEEKLNEDLSEEERSKTKKKSKTGSSSKEEKKSSDDELNENSAEEDTSKTKKKSKKSSKESAEDELDGNSAEEDTSNTKNKSKKSGRPKEAKESVEEKLNEDLSEEERSKTKKKSKKSSNSKEGKASAEDSLNENLSEEEISKTEKKSTDNEQSKESNCEEAVAAVDDKEKTPATEGSRKIQENCVDEDLAMATQENESNSEEKPCEEPDDLENDPPDEDFATFAKRKKSEFQKKFKDRVESCKSTSEESNSDEDLFPESERKASTSKKSRKNVTGSESSDEELAKKTKKGKDSNSEEEDFSTFQRKKRNKKKGNRVRGNKKLVLDSDSEVEDKVSSDEEVEKSDEETLSSDEDSKENKPDSRRGRKRIKMLKNSSDEDDSDKSNNEHSTRKKIKRVLNKSEIAKTTVQAEKEERERKARIAEKQKKYNEIFEADSLKKATVDKLVFDFDEESGEELLKVHPKLVKVLKPHQADGIRFMWNTCFESVKKDKMIESGCILAHCMGLGKTLQVITLAHTLLTNYKKTSVQKVMVVCPVNTVLNWVAEFKQWIPESQQDEYEVYELASCKQNSYREYTLSEWHKNGGVLIIGYDMFRNLTNENNRRFSKKCRKVFHESLVDPGPDLVVCDEGHLLKNEKTGISIAMNKLKTLRRIVLTGTPLQNNLKEYFCMVQFVKPNLLGTYKEYLNRFVNPITNGQYTDSTPFDIQLMRKRSHILHKLLDGVVQRMDYSVLEPYLPPKHEYVLFINLTETQKKLYSHYMNNLARQGAGDTKCQSSFLFADLQEFQAICTHPRVLYDRSIENKPGRDILDDSDSEGSLKDFICDEEEEAKSTSSSSDSDSSGSIKSVKSVKRHPRGRVTRANAALAGGIDVINEELENDKPKQWWEMIIDDGDLDSIECSGKLYLLFEILKRCEAIGDKVLVFSQSLYSLNVIEYFLRKVDEETQDGQTINGFSGSWSIGLDYFRIDGQSSCENRAAWCKSFNDPENIRARLFLISTRAGGLGINLVAANRVIIFDVSWNPSHDIQSIYRVYRFGQTKPCYVYRFVTLGTMEMKVYERQVVKQSISKRVIDEQQIDRHYTQNDIMELYRFEPNPGDRPIPLVPKDIFLGELLQSMPERIYKYHEHQTLLENREDEVLNDEERKAAWEEFENEKKARANPNPGSGVNQAPFGLPMHLAVSAIKSMLHKQQPTASPHEINKMVPLIMSQSLGNDMGLWDAVRNEARYIQQLQIQQQMQIRQQMMNNYLMGLLTQQPNAVVQPTPQVIDLNDE